MKRVNLTSVESKPGRWVRAVSYLVLCASTPLFLINCSKRPPLNTDSSSSSPTPFASAQSTIFDGINDYASASNIRTIFGASQLGQVSVSIWIKPTATPVTYDGVFGATSDGVSWSPIFGAYFTGSSTITFGITGSVNSPSTTVTVGSWNHYVLTFDENGASNQQVKLYRNGSLATQELGLSKINLPDANLEFGRIIGDGSDLNSWNFNGQIDDVAFWSTTLSSDEVAAIYNGGTPTDLTVNSGSYQSSSHLVGYWLMGDNSTAPTISDEVGSSAVTLTNGATFVEDAPP